MSDDYRSMWIGSGTRSGRSRCACWAFLGQAYQDIYLAQKKRPEGMGYFDFVMSEVHGLRIKELVDEKAAGRKIVGSATACSFPRRSSWRPMPPWSVCVQGLISPPRTWKGCCRAIPVP
jgi:hypothetical protein